MLVYDNLSSILSTQMQTLVVISSSAQDEVDSTVCEHRLTQLAHLRSSAKLLSILLAKNKWGSQGAQNPSLTYSPLLYSPIALPEAVMYTGKCALQPYFAWQLSSPQRRLTGNLQHLNARLLPWKPRHLTSAWGGLLRLGTEAQGER